MHPCYNILGVSSSQHPKNKQKLQLGNPLLTTFCLHPSRGPAVVSVLRRGRKVAMSTLPCPPHPSLPVPVDAFFSTPACFPRCGGRSCTSGNIHGEKSPISCTFDSGSNALDRNNYENKITAAADNDISQADVVFPLLSSTSPMRTPAARTRSRKTLRDFFIYPLRLPARTRTDRPDEGFQHIWCFSRRA